MQWQQQCGEDLQFHVRREEPSEETSQMRKDGRVRGDLPGSRWCPGRGVLGWIALGGWVLTGFADRHPGDLTQPDMPSLG